MTSMIYDNDKSQGFIKTVLTTTERMFIIIMK